MLAWLESLGIKAILEWLWGKLSAAFLVYEKQKQTDKQIDEETSAAAKQENEAKTESELDKADNDIFNKL